MDIYLVGGAVRDQLLSLPVKNRDWVVVGATPEMLLAQGYQQVGKDFPVFYLKAMKNTHLPVQNENQAKVIRGLFVIFQMILHLNKI